MLSYYVYFEIKQQKMVNMCSHVECMCVCVCVKFGCKRASGYGNHGKTTQGGGHFFMGQWTPCTL